MRSRVGVIERYAAPMGRAMAPSSRSDGGDGRAHRRTEPGRLYQVPRRNGGSGARSARSGYAPLVPRRSRLLAFVVTVVITLAACTEPAAVSFDPTGPCTADGRVPGAYPELEARIPTSYRDTPPEQLDSGRRCEEESLGSLVEAGVEELHYAGGLWSFGAERSAALVVFRAPGLTAAEVIEFYTSSASVANRTEILATSDLVIAGRPGHRLDTKTVERLQTVVVWPAADPDVVNIVLTNDLPDARIEEAIATFGDR